MIKLSIYRKTLELKELAKGRGIDSIGEEIDKYIEKEIEMFEEGMNRSSNDSSKRYHALKLNVNIAGYCSSLYTTHKIPRG